MDERARGLPALAIRRPWLVIVINLLIVIAGVGAWLGVEVRELPNIDRPFVVVRGDYPGASPETMDAEVTRVVEGAAARVPGVYLVRSGSEEGNFRVVIEFNPGVNLVDAANDVRDAVARIERTLPEGLENLIIVKADADAEPVMQLAVSSPSLPVEELSRAVEDRIEPALIAVPGVADLSLFGQRQRVMRVRVDPLRLAAHNLSVDDVATLLRAARLDVPAGSLDAGDQEVLVRANATAASPESLRALRLGSQLTLGEVADVYFSPADATAFVRLNGEGVINLGVVRQAQSNSVAISAGVRGVIERLNRESPDLRITVVSDEAVFIRGAIAEVTTSLVLAVVIVVAVVALFLGRWRATLVPAAAIPIALVGTLAAIWLLGFSINLITLLALLLATGLVVDDAIVVLENIERRRALGEPARAAAVLGTREVFFAVVATTATLVAVFVPISFLPSASGRLFAEFGFVMAIAVSISSFVALSLGPLIASRMPQERESGPVWRRLSAWGGRGTRLYQRLIGTALAHAVWVLAACVALAAAAAVAYGSLAQELTPGEDRGVLSVRINAPDGASLAYTDRQLEAALAAVQPLKDEGLVTNIFTITGRYDPNRAEIVVPLSDWSQRTSPENSQYELARRVQQALDELPGARVRVRGSGGLSVGGGGGGDGSVQMVVTGDDYARIATAAEAFARTIEERLPALRDVQVDYNASQPQLTLRIDRARASELGVPIEGLDTVLRALVDGTEITELSVDDRTVPVVLQSSARGATDPSDLLNVSVRARTADGDRLVPLSQFVRFEQTAVAPELERFGQRRAVEMSAVVSADVPLQTAVDALRSLAATELPSGMGLLFRGDAATLEQSGNELAITFGLALLVVFLVLVAQFESVTSATVVMLSVPFGLAAAVFAMLASGTSVNLYSQIGLLLLVGVMAKNSILMVEFADQLRDAGRNVLEATLESATTRLRPIVMTMSSTVLGALPLVLGGGPGAEARAAIGWVIFGGLSIAAVFTLFLTPVLYLGLARFGKPRVQQAKRLAAELDQTDRPAP